MSEGALHKPILIVIAGPNGSGKTTITSKVLHHEWLEDSVYINPDIVAQEMFGDWNDPYAVLQALQYCDAKREECLREHRSMIFESVMSTDSKVDFIRRAKKEGYFVRVFFVSTSDPSINASRIAKRVMKGGHGVPIEKIISRYTKSILNGGIVSKMVDRTYVYDNSAEDSEATLLFRLADGRLVKHYVDEVAEWAKGLLP